MVTPGKSITVRLATAADLRAVLSLHKLEREALGHLPSPAIQQRLQAHDISVAVDGLTVVGYLLTYSPRRPGKTQDHVHHVCVAPDWRRRGVATQLLQAAVVKARQKDRAWILAWCRASLPANLFWLACNAIPTHIRPGGDKRGVPIVLWQIPIAPPVRPANLLPVEPHRAGARSANRSDIRHINAREILSWNLLRPGKSCLDGPSAREAARPPKAKVAARARLVAAAGVGRGRSTASLLS